MEEGKDELHDELQKELDEAINEGRFEDCAAIRDKMAERNRVAHVAGQLREVGLTELLEEIKRRTIAGAFAVQVVGEDNRIKTWRMNWGDLTALSGIRNWLSWDLSQKITQLCYAAKNHLYPGLDEDSGPGERAFM